MLAPLILPPAVGPGQPISAAQWNALLLAIRAALPVLHVATPKGTPPHPWQVTVSGRDDEAGHVDIRVNAGLVNDECATVAWAVQDDPRGPLPEASRAAWQEERARLPEDAYLGAYYDRPLYERTPPLLRLKLETDAARLPEGVRPDWVRVLRPPAWIASGAPEDAQWFAAAVVLASFRYNMLTPMPMPKRWRVWAGRANPAAIRQASIGELLQLARIWQARDKGGRILDIRTEQRVWWHLSALASTPDLARIPTEQPPFITGLPLADGFGLGVSAFHELLVSTANAQIETIEAGLTTTEFWTS